MKNGNLTAPELAAIDSMIAYLQKNNKDSINQSFDNIFSNNNCFMAATPITMATIADAYYAVPATNGSCISGWIGMAVNNVAAAANGGALKSDPSENNSFFEKLSDGKKEISLEDLIAIRNKNSK